MDNTGYVNLCIIYMLKYKNLVYNRKHETKF